MRQAITQIVVATPGPGCHECTGAIRDWVAATGIESGLLTVFIQHTSASLLIQENADPDVIADLQTHFSRLAPERSTGAFRDAVPLYRHTLEGPDDMPAHIRSALTATTLAIPVVRGRPALGTWQGIYVFEHRARPHRRHLVLHLLGE